MAKLPDAVSLGQRPAPSPTGRGFQVADVDSNAKAQAGHAMGEAVAGVGDAIFRIQKHVDDARKASEISDVLNRATMDLGEQTLAFQRDQDFKTSPARFKAAADELGAKYAGQFTDDIARETFKREYGRVALSQHLNVMSSAARQEQDSNVAGLDSSLDVYAQAAANAQNPLERDVAIRQAQMAIVAQRKAGWITDVDAEKRLHVFQTKLEHAGVLRDIGNDAGVVAKKLAEDPSYAPNLDPLSRQQLQHTAVVREQQAKTTKQTVEARTDADSAITPVKGTGADIRAGLATWVKDAEARAEKRYPGDIAYRDLVVNRVKSYVSTQVAEQEGKQRLAYVSLIGAVNGTGAAAGKKPLTQDELFGLPGMRDYYSQLDPQQQASVLGHLDHNLNASLSKPAQVNARLVNNIFPRLFLDPNDPKAITKVEQLAQFVPQGLTPEGHTALAAKIDQIQHNPEGKNFSARVERVRRTGHAMIARSFLGQAFPDQAEGSALAFSEAIDKTLDEYRKDPKKASQIESLLTPGSPNYLLRPEYVATFQPNYKQSIEDRADAERRKTEGPPMSELPSGSGKIVKAWIQETGGLVPPGKTQDQAIDEWRKSKGVEFKAPGSKPPRIANDKGWVLMKDASGNQAYVSPDGKQFEEVK